MKNVVVLGKGKLAIQICDWFLNNPDYNLIYVVPVSPSPKWTESLPNWCMSRNINWVQSGDYKHLPDFEIDLAFSCFYDKIIKMEFIGKHMNGIARKYKYNSFPTKDFTRKKRTRNLCDTPVFKLKKINKDHVKNYKNYHVLVRSYLANEIILY